MKNQKRNTANEEKNHAIKREIGRSCDHNSNNKNRKKYNTYYRNYLKKKKNQKNYIEYIFKKKK